MQTDDFDNGRPFIHVPVTQAELPEARPADLGLLMRLFAREVYEPQVAHHLRVLAGEEPSITQSSVGDDWETARDMQKLAEEMPAYSRLATELSRNAFRIKWHAAIKNVVFDGQVSFRALQDQGRHKLIEDQRARRAAEEAAKEAAE